MKVCPVLVLWYGPAPSVALVDSQDFVWWVWRLLVQPRTGLAMWRQLSLEIVEDPTDVAPCLLEAPTRPLGELKGPLYSAMFNPLGTVITTISACLVLREQLHIGSLVGAVAVVGGLYIVLWGKAKDIDPKSSCSNSHLPCVSENMTVAVDPGLRDGVCGLQKPLLGESLGTQDNQMED
ncbi:hypothetical protein B296_00024507 [Ensete ventricosum]|uniref:WAT1-related protein n=1 Tax=Ensete ventricosum TaxID=4639 RepID=A0A426YPJ5_ENSVE|nr:hypothetical protein B296_00024507 [Ensete ventricosum]